MRDAGGLAEDHALRGYDAIHLAAARQILDDDGVVVSNDQELLRAAQALGLSVAVLR